MTAAPWSPPTPPRCCRLPRWPAPRSGRSPNRWPAAAGCGDRPATCAGRRRWHGCRSTPPCSIALIGDQSPAPVVAAPTLPGWVGPLDIVVVLAGAVDDRPAAEAAAEASRRGARVVVRASSDGPVAAAAGAALLEPQVSVPEALAGAARLAVLAAVAAAAGLYPRPDFAAAADQLDAMAMACHPSSEFFVNPGADAGRASRDRHSVADRHRPGCRRARRACLSVAGRSGRLCRRVADVGAGSGFAAGAGQGRDPRRRAGRRGLATSSGTRMTTRPTRVSRSAPCWSSGRRRTPLPVR